MGIATAGSCFAQHIGRHLKASNAIFLDVEPVAKFIREGVKHRFGYDMYSARYGNIYTARQLRQLIEEVQALEAWPIEIWEKNGRYFDAMRPSVEPSGFASAEELTLHRQFHIARLKELFAKTDLFVFTLGLTEAWRNKTTGRVYPICPGVSAGEFDERETEFYLAGYGDIRADLEASFAALRGYNPNMKFLLTVSPVPLAATARPHNHVLNATSHSKASLRAVAGDLAESLDFVDYFPSYELITGAPFAGAFYDESLRNVTAEGAAFVMELFFLNQPHIKREGGALFAGATDAIEDAQPDQRGEAEDVICEEVLLDAFSK